MQLQPCPVCKEPFDQVIWEGICPNCLGDIENVRAREKVKVSAISPSVRAFDLRQRAAKRNRHHCGEALNQFGLCPNCDYCQHCGHFVNEQGYCPLCDYCKRCGELLNLEGECELCVICPECGSHLDKENKCILCDFCLECGEELDSERLCPRCDYCYLCHTQLDEYGLCPDCGYCQYCGGPLDEEQVCYHCAGPEEFEVAYNDWEDTIENEVMVCPCPLCQGTPERDIKFVLLFEPKENYSFGTSQNYWQPEKPNVPYYGSTGVIKPQEEVEKFYSEGIAFNTGSLVDNEDCNAQTEDTNTKGIIQKVFGFFLNSRKR